MLLQIDTENTPVSQLRAIVALISLAADERSEAQPAGFSEVPPPPSIAPAGDAEDDDAADAAVQMPGDVLTPPPPPPPPPAPTTAPTVQVQPPGFEFDSANVAWNPDIHSSTKSKMKNGEWKKKRNRNAETPPTVSTAPAAPPPPPPSIPAMPPPPPVAPPPAAALPAAATGPTFRSVVAKVGELQKAHKLPPEVLAAILATVGAVDLMSLLSMPHLVPAVDEAINKATA